MFLLYAEDRGLMPGGDLYVRNYSVHGLFERLRDDNEQYPDTMDQRYGSWPRLVALFRAVYAGCQHPQLKMPARSGYLFDPDRFDPDETEELHARRIIAQRCLYGVDKNPMAVDLAKLSLWLATLAKDHPFTFVDHSLRSGDSLVGLTREQIVCFHWEPTMQRRLYENFMRERVERATAARREILEAGDTISPELKREKLAKADEAMDLVRFIGDLAVAAFFEGENDKKRKERRGELLEGLTVYLDPKNMDLSRREPLAEAVERLRSGSRPIVPFHWETEFPEVFGRDKHGFDGIVGNPPFMGGTRISEVAGMAYFQWLVNNYPPCEHHCDLVAYFFRRAYGLLGTRGCLGLLATNTVAQGDTREGGLRTILRDGGQIYEAIRRYRWPGLAAVCFRMHVYE